MLIVCITALLLLCIVYPYLSGGYDPLALPLSTMAQVFGVVGLPLALVGLLWFIMPRHRLVFAIVSIVVATFVALILVLFATFSVGKTFGILTLTIWVYIVIQLIPKLKSLKNATGNDFNPAPLYLLALPTLTLILQLVLATPLTRWSKSRAILNANAFIGDIEEYYEQHGHYPFSLQAQHKDYYPDVVGVERYLYAPQGKGYNLSFEQPRFLLDRFGTREWVVYNSRNEHRAYSHTAWLLLRPDEVERSQGWYASGDTGHSHWKYFFFD